MAKLRFILCVLGVALATSSVSLAKKKSWDEIVRELKEAKLTASHLVGEFNASQPSKDDSLHMREKYDLARGSYFKWAEEAADAVEHGKDIKRDSEEAKNARQYLKELGDFAKKYAQNRHDEIVFGLAPKTKPPKTPVDLPTVVDDGNKVLSLIKTIDDFIKAQRAKTLAERKAAADEILKDAEWPDFGTIK